jgi:hypothetical protein
MGAHYLHAGVLGKFLESFEDGIYIRGDLGVFLFPDYYGFGIVGGGAGAGGQGRRDRE